MILKVYNIFMLLQNPYVLAGQFSHQTDGNAVGIDFPAFPKAVGFPETQSYRTDMLH